ncbi:uncharacterized protein [Littorina saxatilis]|uniref:uncharacterized protein isoform X2 n=1 Tax=Littorina saxatilis TaxID=31220 RepID=UPI0038B693E2
MCYFQVSSPKYLGRLRSTYKHKAWVLIKSLLLLLAVLLLLKTWTGHQLTEHHSSTSAPGGARKRDFGGTKELDGQRDEACDMCDEPFAIQPSFLGNSAEVIGNETIPVFRHFSNYEPWPAMTPQHVLPGQMPSTVHYLWCGKGYFAFHHYLGVLSLIRLLQPVKLVFHYARLPQLDYLLYNTWFLELKQSVPGLTLKPLHDSERSPCVSGQFLHTALSLLRQTGGVYVTSNVILSHVPPELQRQTLWSAFAGHPGASDLSRGVIIASKGFGDKLETDFIRHVSSTNAATCVSPKNYEFPRAEPTSDVRIRCVFISDGQRLERVYPKDIMDAKTPFAELSRWLFYGTRAPLLPKTVPNSIPRISHMVWISPNNSSKSEHLQFDQYLSILSALHVGGFHHVYVHGTVGFSGEWWERLNTENVTFVYVEDPQTVFQQKVVKLAKKSNILRNAILYKYGGAYHDVDAVWTQRVPDWLLAYPAVGGRDWVVYGEWPDNLNNGVLLAKPRAPWVGHLQAYHRYYTESGHWTRSLYGAIMATYRTFERHPDQLLLFDHLQVMCHHSRCHPSWEKGFRRGMGDQRKTLPFDWRTDTLVVHVTQPAVTSFASPDALKKGTDMMAEIGRFILKKSGREDILR